MTKSLRRGCIIMKLCDKLGGQDRVAVECPHPNKEDVGSNLAATRNKKWTLGWPPAQKVPQ